MKTILILLAFLAALAGAFYASYSVWNLTGEAEMGGHGIAALILGIVFTFALGAGLMALVFYSNRKGYDEQARSDDSGLPPPLSPTHRSEAQQQEAADRREE